MKAEERQKRIEEYLQKAEFASLEDLARLVKTSISTVRRDVEALASGGNIRRTHGGARLINSQANEFVFSWRNSVQRSEKDAIGKMCASLIQPGQNVIIDSGTTVFHVAQQLEPQVLHIITNSLPVANLFAPTQRIEVMVSGGVIYRSLGVLVGQLAEDAFSKIHADVAIMGGGGITPEGITNSDALLINVQKAMIRAASKVVFCLDHTKFGRRSVAPLCGLSDIDCIVTDAEAPPELVKSLRARGVEVLIAPKSDTAPSLAPAHKRIPPAKTPAPPSPKKSRATNSPVESTGSESNDRMGWD